MRQEVECHDELTSGVSGDENRDGKRKVVEALWGPLRRLEKQNVKVISEQASTKINSQGVPHCERLRLPMSLLDSPFYHHSSRVVHELRCSLIEVPFC